MFPSEEGPLFPEDSAAMIDEFATFLQASDADVADAVARQNRLARGQTSFELFAKDILSKKGILPIIDTED